MDGLGVDLHLSEAELELWMSTPRRAACLLTMERDEIPPGVLNRVRIALLEMAHRLDCELIRQAAWDAELEGKREWDEACVWCGKLLPAGVRIEHSDCKEYHEGDSEPELMTLPREWER